MITPLFGSTTTQIPQVETLDLALNKPTDLTLVTSSAPTAIVTKAKQYDLTLIDDQQVVLFGSDRQRAIGESLDKLLTELTKEQNPILFELFKKLKKGVESADIGELEKEIRKSQEKGAFGGLLDAIGLSSVVKRLEKANEKIGNLLTSKSKSLLDLTREMEVQIQTEVAKLINDTKRLSTLAQEYRTNVDVFGEYVEVGKLVLSNAKDKLLQLQAHANTTGNSNDIETAKLFAQRVDLFETRLVTLETILQKAPAELEAIRLSQGASLSTLGETANSALEEFNDIKSILIKLSVTHQIATVQSVNAQRKELRDSLQSHGTDLLGQTAVAAAKAQGQNRVDDANKLLQFATKVNDISNKVEAEKAANQTRFTEARNSLLQVKKLIEK